MNAQVPPAEILAPDRSQALTAQSLACGQAGDALLPIELAVSGAGAWPDAYAALAAAIRYPVTANPAASLYLGAPAIAFAFHTADRGSGRLADQLAALDARTDSIARQRLHDANARIDAGLRPCTSEYDLFYGLTGFGAHYLAHHPGNPLLHAILTYLVRLTQPIPGDHHRLPGWWTARDPRGRIRATFAHDHMNLGMAHGISGPLTLMSTAARQGITTSGLLDAIDRICHVLDNWRQESPAGPWWPPWITLPEHAVGRLSQTGPGRPSWCYGTPGQARAQQLAGVALGDQGRQDMATQALRQCLTDPGQLRRIGDATLCHGTAGILIITHHAARDAPPGTYTVILRRLRVQHDDLPPLPDGGLLEGATGRALATLCDDAAGQTASGWDTCILPSV